MKKPDAFEEMVENKFGPTQTLLRGEVIALLRQQHKKFRGMVSRYHAASVRLAKISKHRDISLAALTRLSQCKEILAALDTMAKGGKG